jgi:L-fucose isomerase
MPVTLVRLNLVKGLGPVLQLAEGQTLDRRTSPTWPSTWFAPCLGAEGAFRDVYSVMANWGANHGAFCYGHVGEALLALAALLRIPVSMHNVRADRVFRPAVWSAFGMDPEGADYRACAALGPLYGRR